VLRALGGFAHAAGFAAARRCLRFLVVHVFSQSHHGHITRLS